MNNAYSISKNFSLSREIIRNIEKDINILNFLDRFSFLQSKKTRFSFKELAQHIFDFLEWK